MKTNWLLIGMAADGPEFGWEILYTIAFLRKVTAEMNRQMAGALGRPEAESDALTDAANVHLGLPPARDVKIRVALTWARARNAATSGKPFASGIGKVVSATVEAERSNSPKAPDRGD